jgi:probable HAF family extracellular repeat protein
VVVGQGSSTSGNEAFRWTQAGGIVGLGGLAGGSFYSYASGVSADGAVVVGQSSSTSGNEAFRWTQAGGMVSVASWLSAAGVSATGWTILSLAATTNSDGSVVVGYGTSANGTEAFIARVAGSSSGIVGLTDLTISLASQVAPQSQLSGLTALSLNGAHYRPLMDMAMTDGQSCGWASGDLGRINSSGNGWTSLAEVGACHDFANKALRAGLGIGHSQSSTDQANNGHSRLNGEYVLAELDWAIPNTNLIASVLGMTGRWDADMRRGDSSSTALSTGATKLDSNSLRARLDWRNVFSVRAIEFSPSVQLTATHTNVDAYQEIGGNAPASFNSQTHTANESRLGLTGAYALNEATTLFGRTEWVHRFDANDTAVSGVANILNIAAMPFAIKGNAIRQDWVRVGAELVRRISARNQLSVSGNVASTGQDADLSLGISWNMFF